MINRSLKNISLVLNTFLSKKADSLVEVDISNPDRSQVLKEIVDWIRGIDDKFLQYPYSLDDNTPTYHAVKGWIQRNKDFILVVFSSNDKSDSIFESPWKLNAFFNSFDAGDIPEIPYSVLSKKLKKEEILDDVLHTMYQGRSSKPWIDSSTIKEIEDQYGFSYKKDDYSELSERLFS